MIKLKKYLRPYAIYCVVGPIFKLLEAIFELIIPLVVASIIDVGLINKDMDYVYKMIIIMIVLGSLGYLFSFICQYSAAIASQGFGTNLRADLYHHINELSYEQLNNQSIGSLITRMTNDINQIEVGIARIIRLAIRAPFLIIGSIIMAMMIDLKLSIIFIITAPLLALLIYIIMKCSVPLYKTIQAKLDEIYLTTIENLRGMRVIKAFSKQKEENKKFRKQSEEHAKASINVAKIGSLLNPLSYTLINIAIVFILYYGGIQVNIGVLSQGQIVAFVNYMTQILFALLALTKLIILFTKASASSIRVNEILEIPIMSSGTKTNIEDNETIVEFKDVNFKYPNAKNNVLSNINFTINKNETVGIIGGTGSGKTTIISLILKFYKTSSGTINYYDEPINNYEAKALRNSISICPQNAMLINDSIVDNLKIANIDATNDEIQQALNTALAAEFVNSYPYNIHTIIEQGGKNLSGGQLQRLCIARTLLRKTNLYIFDDSFSALDYNSESIILNNLKKIKSAKLFITQKVNTISDCDKIIVLDNSRIVGCGTHIQLLNSCNVYKEIYDSQNLSEVGSND